MDAFSSAAVVCAVVEAEDALCSVSGRSSDEDEAGSGNPAQLEKGVSTEQIIMKNICYY